MLDELLTFFGVRHHDPAERAAPDAPDAPDAPADPQDAAADSDSDFHAAASPDLVVVTEPERPGLEAAPAATAAAATDTPAEPAAAPPRRAARRSRREAKREAKRAAKGEAKQAERHAKEAKQAAKRAAKQARRDAKQAKQQARAAKRAEPAGDAPTDATTAPPVAPADGSSELVRIVPPSVPTSVPPEAPPAVGPGAPFAPPEPASAVVPTELPAPPPSAPDQPDASPRPTVSIADRDDLPDPVYLETLLEEGAAEAEQPPRVFIDDKDPATGTIVSLEAAAEAARMEPRLRERRIAVKRALGRKRLKWAAVAASIVLVVVGVLATLGSGVFDVKRIRVEGAVYSQGAELDAVLDELGGANVLRVDTRRLERQLEAIPWVASARVTADFPNGATVELAEREPLVAYQGEDLRWRVLDIDGRVLAVTGGQPARFLEVAVSGDEAPNLPAGSFAPDGLEAAAALVQALGGPLREQVEVVSVDVEGTDLRMRLVEGIEVRFGAASDLRGKLVRLQLALLDRDPAGVRITMIDVSAQNDYVLR